MFEKRFLDLSVDEFFNIVEPKLKRFVDDTVEKAIKDTDRKELRDKVVTVNELVKMKVVGARTRILSLIKKGLIEQTTDNKIIYSSVLNYLKNKNEQKKT